MKDVFPPLSTDLADLAAVKAVALRYGWDRKQPLFRFFEQRLAEHALATLSTPIRALGKE